MTQLITSPDKFADLFNAKVPGAYRQVMANDIRLLTQCGLIGRYGYYIQLDIETVRAILQYEQLRQNRQKRDEIRSSDGVIHCRRCGVVLDVKPNSKAGRPREYCQRCESARSRDRNRKWRKKRQAILA